MALQLQYSQELATQDAALSQDQLAERSLAATLPGPTLQSLQPTPVKVDPSITTSTDAFLTPPKTTFDIQAALQQNMASRNQLTQQIAASLKPSSQELGYQTELNTIQDQASTLQLNTQNQIDSLGLQPMVTKAVATRQQAEAGRQGNVQLSRFALQEQAAAKKLDVAFQQRQGEIEALKFQLQSGEAEANDFFQLAQLQRQQEQDYISRIDKLQDNARQTITTLLTNFGGLAFEDLSPETQAQVQQLARAAGIPEGLLREGMQTIKDKQLLAQMQQFQQQMQFKGQQEQFDQMAKLQELAIRAANSAQQAALNAMLSKDGFARVNTLADNARQDENIKTFNSVRDSYQRILKSVDAGNGVGDLALLRSFAKLTDPSTGVREEEYRTMQDAMGAVQALGVKVSQGWWNGQQLTPEGRLAFKNLSEQLYNEHLGNYQQAVDYYTDLAVAAGVDPKYVIRPITVESSQPQAPTGFVGPVNPTSSTSTTTRPPLSSFDN